MPKPKIYPRTLYVRVPKGTHDKIVRLAQKNNTTKAELTRRLIYRQLNQIVER